MHTPPLLFISKNNRLRSGLNRNVVEVPVNVFLDIQLLMDLLIPLTMVGFGKLFRNQPPKNINAVFGYRTTMSVNYSRGIDLGACDCPEVRTPL